MRDFDLFIEIAKRSPFLAAGLCICLIGPTGQVLGTDISVFDPWRTLNALVGIVIFVWQGCLLWDAQRLLVTDLPTGQQPQDVLSRLMIHSSTTEKTELIARTDGLELNFSDYRQPSRSRRYLLRIDELKNAQAQHDIYITERSSKSPKFGRLSIGRLNGWLYNRKLHPNPDRFQQ